ncbi:hypothetical protein JCM15519_17370 [Fundidesulfovibrio butyratiphilus]
MRDALSLIATALVIAGVWRIGRMDVRGQWCMLWAQIVWLCWALESGAWGLAAQSVILGVLTWRAIRLWSRAGAVK